MADDRRIETLPSLSSALYLHRLDEVVKLQILRGNEKKTLYVPAIEQHDHMDELLDKVNPENSLIPRLGVLGVDHHHRTNCAPGSDPLRIPSGVIVVGLAADLILPETGLQAGDLQFTNSIQPPSSRWTHSRAAVRSLKSGEAAVVFKLSVPAACSIVSFELE